MRVVVLGGTGYLGSRVVRALSAVPGLEVVAASRRGPVPVDVTRPETYGVLERSQLVVDLTDATSTPPDGVIHWCLERGLTVIEATSDAPCVERLHRDFAAKGLPGRLVLGGGIFTGVSNLLGRAVATRCGAKRLTLGISSSPFSGAGGGTIELMVRALGVPAVRYVHGARLEVKDLERGPKVDFGGIARPTVRISLAEPFMLATSTGAADVDVYFAPRPAFLVPAFAMLPGWVVRAGWYQAFMKGYFLVLRKWLLGGRASAVELVARGAGAKGEAGQVVTTRDGMLGGAYALAAMVEEVARAAAWSGVRFIDDVTELEPIIARANALAGEALLRSVSLSPIGGEARGEGKS
ncbi:MAG: hypothetical protein AB1938_10925 [Myxococcota bacterium]